MTSYQYAEREITWPDGSAVPAELRTLLLDSLQPGFEIERGEFAWDAGSRLAMTFRMSVLRPRQKPRTWEVKFSCSAHEATAVRPDATFAEREWFAMMVKTRIAEWLNGVPSIIEAARLVQ